MQPHETGSALSHLSLSLHNAAFSNRNLTKNLTRLSSNHGHFLTSPGTLGEGVVAVLHEQPVGGVAAGGGGHVAHLHVVVVLGRALRPELPPVVETTD